MAGQQIELLAVTDIDPPSEPDRVSIDAAEIAELAASIREVGLLQPILVARNGSRYEIVAGHRRFMAHLHLGASTINCVVCSLGRDEIAIVRATENLKRENLTPLEEAKVYWRLNSQYGLGWDEIGRRIGKSPGVCKRRCDILGMPELLQAAIHKKQISVGVGEELWRIKDPVQMEYYLGFAIENGITVSVAREWAHEYERACRTVPGGVGGGGGFRHPADTAPTYVACDLCREAMVIGQELVFRACPACAAAVSAALKKQP